jgi:pimeloyl-ACP methyl ester carboxylesterase
LNLIGSSFGGSVALVMSNWERINKVIALSPVIDFTGQGGRSEQDLMRLMNYIRRAFGYAYRFGKKDWLKLVSGRILKPAEINNAKKEKILIFLDKLDREVDYKKIYRFAETNGLKTIQVSNLGHLSFSKLKGSLLKRAVQWLKTNN